MVVQKHSARGRLSILYCPMLRCTVPMSLTDGDTDRPCVRPCTLAHERVVGRTYMLSQSCNCPVLATTIRRWGHSRRGPSQAGKVASSWFHQDHLGPKSCAKRTGQIFAPEAREENFGPPPRASPTNCRPACLGSEGLWSWEKTVPDDLHNMYVEHVHVHVHVVHVHMFKNRSVRWPLFRVRCVRYERHLSRTYYYT